MTPIEKAKELINRYRPYAYGNDNQEDHEQIFYYKQCALIVVDEILLGYMGNPKVKYWTEVKQEIEKL
jgi:hypothetical protein